MAAGDKIPLVLKGALAGAAEILGATYAEVEIATVEADEPQAAGAAGAGDGIESSEDIRATVYGINPTALVALRGTKANLVLKYQDTSGNQKLTLKNFRFRRFGKSLNMQAKDAGGKAAPWAISGRCVWTSTDAFADMFAFSADT